PPGTVPPGAVPSQPAEPPGTPAADGALTRKQDNDAAAYIRGLAQLRGRNADWAERAVREAASLSASDALELGVIDLVADDVARLAARLDGRRVVVLGQERVLRLAGAALRDVRPDWRARLLTTITNPSIALLLMTVGIYGLIFEFMSPGAIVPGVVGAICLLLGLYALQLLPVNYVGLALIVLGIGLMVAESFLPSFGLIGLGGIVAFVVGALMLVDTELPGFGIPPGLVGALALVSFAVVAGTAGVALRTRRLGAVSGAGQMLGASATVLDSSGREGWAEVAGEIWRVSSDLTLRRGQTVRIVARTGHLLQVTPIDPDKGE
ncbi:NfeD family protein, partial [Massilia glaciei]